MSLTDTFIRNVKPASSPRKYFDGKTKLLSFGKYPTVGLRDARARKEGSPSKKGAKGKKKGIPRV